MAVSRAIMEWKANVCLLSAHGSSLSFAHDSSRFR